MFIASSRSCVPRWLALQKKPFHSSQVYMNEKRNIVVVGGSYVGAWAAQFAAASMHKTHQTILVEQNSHFQHLFAFPRYAVVPTHEHKAFIPFTDGLLGKAPPNSTSIINAKTTEVLPNQIILDHGGIIDYDYLILATGTKLSPPGSLATRTKQDGILYFQNHQALVSQAADIILIGGGAVGVQMATDIKDRYPEKSVTLIHSRTQLMNAFHIRLHEIVLKRCTELGINVILGDRAKVPPGGFPTDPTSIFEIELTSGRKVSTNLAIICTGQTPLSDPLRSLSPSSIEPQKGSVLVKPTLQIIDARYPNIFAIGDVAKTGGHKAARPGLAQAQLVARNIAVLASGKGQLGTYKPDAAEIGLTLGMTANVEFSDPSTPGGEPQINIKDDGAEDMRIEQIWRMKAPGVLNYHL